MAMGKSVHGLTLALLLGIPADRALEARQPADIVPPVLTATVTPQASATGWHQTAVTIDYVCSDTGSGVKKCPESMTVYAEGAGQTISASAEDHAGNVATTSVTVSIDMSAPELGVESPAYGAIVYTPTVTINGMLADLVSGVAALSCAGSPGVVAAGAFSCAVTLQPGINDVSIEAVDVAGNVISTAHRLIVGDRLTVAPSSLTIPMDGAHQLRLIHAQGSAVTDAEWTVSDPAVVGITGAGGTATVTGIAPGQATITAAVDDTIATATVTVSTESSLPAGHVRWSLSPTSSDAPQDSLVIHAQNDSGEGADLFWVESVAPHLHIRGVAHDGAERWRVLLPYAIVWGTPFSVADPQGGLILNIYRGDIYGSLVMRFDGRTGAETWRLESSASWSFYGAAVHPVGLVLVQKSSGERDALSNALVAIDTLTGREVFTVPLAVRSEEVFNCSNSIRRFADPPYLTVAPDGHFYAVETHHRQASETTCGLDTTTYSLDQIVTVLKIDAAGATTRTVLDTFRRRSASIVETSGWRPPWTVAAVSGPRGGVIVSLVRAVDETTTTTTRLQARRSGFSTRYMTTLIKIEAGVRADYELAGYARLLVITSSGEGRAEVDGPDWARLIQAIDLSTGGVIWTTTVQDSSSIVSTLADGSVLLSEPWSGAFWNVDVAGHVTALPGITAPMATIAVNNDLIGVLDGRLTAFVGFDTPVDAGVWPMPDGNHQRQRAAPVPALVAEPATLVRGQTVSIRVTGLVANQVQNWTFRPLDATLPQIVRGPTSQLLDWSGMMVTSGAVRLSIQQGGQARQLSRSIMVTNRDWKLPPVSPQETENGTGGFALLDPPDPPVNGGASSRLGESQAVVRILPIRNMVDDFGPNDGLHYITGVTDQSTFRYTVINSLKQPQSDFYLAQCGTGGFISGATLLRNTLQHEAGVVPVSHYTNYRTALMMPSQNPKTLIEPLVAPGGAELDQKARGVALSGIQPIIDAIVVEPCGGRVEYDSAAGCVLKGRINFMFEPCP